MVTPTAGEVVLVASPFSDLSQSRVRLAVCLADAGRGDGVLCQITSRVYGDPAAVPLDAPGLGIELDLKAIPKYPARPWRRTPVSEADGNIGYI